MRKIRVLVVDDSVVIRKLLRTVIDQQEDLEVVGTAANGIIALMKLDQTPPDVITMDLDMPVMDGLQAVRALRERGLRIPVIMVSSATHRCAEKTLDSLKAGADDFIAKPGDLTDFSQCLRLLEADLIPKIRALAHIEPVPVPERVADRVTGIQPPLLRQKIRALLVGSSTGGPFALDLFFRELGGNLGVPVLVVQHMPAFFTKNLADRMDQNHVLRFHEAVSGDVVQKDHVYIAPGGMHMEVVRKENEVRILTHDNPMENFCRPSVDVLFRSAVQVYDASLIAVVLTGMGRDGCSGAGMIASIGGLVLVQDEASSVVWGMPGAVVEAGHANAVLTIPEIASQIRKTLNS